MLGPGLKKLGPGVYKYTYIIIDILLVFITGSSNIFIKTIPN